MIAFVFVPCHQQNITISHILFWYKFFFFFLISLDSDIFFFHFLVLRTMHHIWRASWFNGSRRSLPHELMGFSVGAKQIDIHIFSFSCCFSLKGKSSSVIAGEERFTLLLHLKSLCLKGNFLISGFQIPYPIVDSRKVTYFKMQYYRLNKAMTESE